MIDLIGFQKEYVVHIKNLFFGRGFLTGSITTGIFVIIIVRGFGL